MDVRRSPDFRSRTARRFPVRKETRWLALVLVGACGTTASAQSPLMYGAQTYPPYPQPVPQAYYYYAQPQPRVVYVQATPVAPASKTPADSGAADNPAANSDTSNRKVPAKPASLQQDNVLELPPAPQINGGLYVGPDFEDDVNVLPKGRWTLQALGGVYSD